MIFKVVCRKDGGQLARYLLSSKNDRVAVLNLSGTVEAEANADGLKAALQDMDELGKMTRGKKTLVHLAINPNDRDRLEKRDWQYCVAKAEVALGLTGQPRAIVSHVFHGKEHFHVVWSRVDIENAKCIQLSHSKLKMVQAAREVEIDLGLHRTPDRNRGMAKEQQFTADLKEGQRQDLERQLNTLPNNMRGSHRLNQDVIRKAKFQEERVAQPKREREVVIQTAWHKSSNGAEFRELIEQAGYRLAIGRRGFLVVDVNFEPHSISRAVEGVKQKHVQTKLEDLKGVPTIDDLKTAKLQSTRRVSRSTTQQDLIQKMKAISEVELKNKPPKPFNI